MSVTDAPKPVVLKRDSSYPVGAVRMTLAVRSAPETMMLCEADAEPAQTVIAAKLPVTDIVGVADTTVALHRSISGVVVQLNVETSTSVGTPSPILPSTLCPT